MEIKIEASKRNKKYIEAILPSMLRQLKLESSRKALVIRVADECGDDCGLTLNMPGFDSIMVVIKPTRKLLPMSLTLAHEMVHVKQYAKGQVKHGKRGAVIWKGKSYPKSTPYLDSPWEIDAFRQQELILRRAFED